MLSKISPRAVLALIGLAAVGLLLGAVYAQYGPGKQQPCPLCILQRYAFLALAAVCLLAAVHGPRRAGMAVYATVAGLCAGTGTGLALWHVTKGGSMTSCLADPVGEFVNGLPPAEWLPEFFFASGGCADRYPPILGLYVPQWSLLWFSVFFCVIAAAFVANSRRDRRF